MVASEPRQVHVCQRKSDMRYNWIHVRLDAIDLEEAARARDRRVADVRAEKSCGTDQLIGYSRLGVAVPATQSDDAPADLLRLSGDAHGAAHLPRLDAAGQRDVTGH